MNRTRYWMTKQRYKFKRAHTKRNPVELTGDSSSSSDDDHDDRHRRKSRKKSKKDDECMPDAAAEAHAPDPWMTVRKYRRHEKISIVGEDTTIPMAHGTIIDDEPLVTKEGAAAFKIGVDNVGWFKAVSLDNICTGYSERPFLRDLIATPDFERFEGAEATKLGVLKRNQTEEGYLFYHQHIVRRLLGKARKRTTTRPRKKK